MKNNIWSHSRINCYKTCPKQYEYKYINRLIPLEKSSALNIGTGFHKCIELNDVDAALDWMDEQTDFINEGDETNKIIAAAMGEAFLNKFSGHNDGDIEHEYHIVHTLPNGEQVQLYLDALVKTPNGLIIREYKTSSRVDDTYLAKLDFNDQISRYWAIVEKELNQPVIKVEYYIAKKPLLRQKQSESLTQYRDRLVEKLMEEDNITYRELTRTKEEIDEAYEDFIYDIERAKSTTRFTKNLTACSSYGTCPYMQLCMKAEGAIASFQEIEEEDEDGITEE